MNIGLYRDIGPAEYMPHAYRERIHYPPPFGAEPEYDLAFVGTGFPSRVRFFHQMDLAGLNVRLGGLWMDLPEDSPMRDWTAITDDADDCVDNHEVAAIYRRPGPASTSTAAKPRTATTAKAGRSAPARSRWPRAGCCSPATRAPNPTSCSPCSRRSPARTRPETSSAGRSPTRAWPRNWRRRPRAAVADRTFTEHAKQLLRLLDRQPVTM